MKQYAFVMLLMVLCFYLMTAEAQGEKIDKKLEATSLTVFVDAPLGQRKRGSAKKLNKSHKKYAAKGYRLIDVETYIENGDLEGFFVSYVKVD